MIPAQSNALSLAGLFYIPQLQGCTGSRHSAKKSSQYLSKPDIHQPNICPMFHQQPGFRNQYAPAREAIQAVIPRGGERFSVAGGFQREGFSIITTRERYFSESKKKGSIASATLSTTANEYQPFGSVPRDCNSFRIIRLIQAARDSSPSCCWAVSINSLSSGSSLNWNGGLPLRSFLCVDTLATPIVMYICVMTHYYHMIQKTMPRSGGTLAGHLTTTDSIIIEVAEMDHTTHPKGRHSVTQKSGTDPVSFVWIIAAVRRDCPTVKATIHHIAAATEREARRTLAKDHVCFFAGRIRQGVAHA